MATFKVIEGTVWEIEADTIEQAKAYYEGYFKGDDTDAVPMKEVAGDSYWYGEEFKDGAQYALEYLSDLYEGVEETDIWADYMDEEASE
jgi:hypothetical protein